MLGEMALSLQALRVPSLVEVDSDVILCDSRSDESTVSLGFDEVDNERRDSSDFPALSWLGLDC